MKWRKICHLTIQELAIHDNFYFQSQTGCIDSGIKSDYYQLALDNEFIFNFQEERYRIVITQTVFARDF
jgi:hypothetical protein